MSSHCNKFADDTSLWAALRNDLDLLSQNLAFKCLYEKHYRSIEFFVCGNSGTETDARDAFQEIIMVLCKYCRKPDFKPHVKVKTFIDAIGRRWWFHRLRGRKGEEIYTDLNQLQINEEGEVETNTFVNLPDPIPETEGREDFLAALDQAFGQMEDKCRLILRLTYWDDLRDDAIASMIGSAVGSVKVLRHRCMERLRGFFKEKIERA
ncbi:MAG: sigma-70 family RNA polymerase sigma factor [Phycisphaerae bacterium]|nr:sigma-70 family RNA polymerase sigma factor [Saprospiraceae bacterium]